MTKLGWEVPITPPKVISIFLTGMSYWWNKFPPIETKVKFVEIRLLDDFLKNL